MIQRRFFRSTTSEPAILKSPFLKSFAQHDSQNEASATDPAGKSREPAAILEDSCRYRANHHIARHRLYRGLNISLIGVIALSAGGALIASGSQWWWTALFLLGVLGAASATIIRVNLAAKADKHNHLSKEYDRLLIEIQRGELTNAQWINLQLRIIALCREDEP